MIDIERIKSIKGKLSGFIDHHDVAEPTIEEFLIIVDELISIRELKGDQVPVAYLYMGDAMECKHVELAEDMDEGQAENCVPLFTAPQKPVVLPPLRTRDDYESRLGNGDIGPYNHGHLEGWNAAIEAAGGIVKDGE